MVRELAIAFAVFWFLVTLAAGFGLAVAMACGGQGFRDLFREATMACALLCATAIAVAVGAPQ